MNSEDDVVDRLFAWMGGEWAADRVEQKRASGIAPGFADIMFSYGNRRGLIEAKFIRELAAKNNQIGLTRDQSEFLVRHGRHCSCVFVALGIGATDQLRLYPYTQAPLLLQKLASDEVLGLGRAMRSPGELKLFLSGRAGNGK